MTTLRLVTTDELTERDLRQLRALMHLSFPGFFTEEDWMHTLGGRHALVTLDGLIVAHAALVERALVAGSERLNAGYVEGVATAPDYRNLRHASNAMRAVSQIIDEEFDLGGLSTGVPGFFERLGWERWRGQTFVDGPDGRTRTPEDDDGVMVRRTRRTLDLDATSDLVCEWRRGEVW